MAEEEIDTQLERCKMMSNSQIGARFLEHIFWLSIVVVVVVAPDRQPTTGWFEFPSLLGLTAFKTQPSSLRFVSFLLSNKDSASSRAMLYRLTRATDYSNRRCLFDRRYGF